MQLVIVAGGKGTRLKERLGNLPKPMVDVAGKPLLAHQVLLARNYGIEDIVFLAGHGAEAIRDYFGDGSRWGARIRYFEEERPLGTAGAVLSVADRLAGRFLVMYGDTILNVDLSRFWRSHEASGAAASLFLHPNDHPADSDLVELDENSLVVAFHPYPHDAKRYYANLVNAALYVIERDALLPWKGRTDLPDFGKHLFPHMLAAGAALHGYRSPEYIKDAGTPERLDRVIADYRSGKIERGSFATPAPAVFLDRDGTLNEEVNRVKSAEELRVFDGAAAAIRLLNRSEYRAVIITNQPVVARGDCTEEELHRIHNRLETELGREGAYLDAIYFCPHHPDKGFPGERPDLKIRCDCRKPETGLIRRAVADLNLDLGRSWLIGDSSADTKTAANARISSILVQTGHAGKDGRYPDQPGHVFPDLNAAVRFILGESN
ncbi:MAG: HAD-IIIA family hydrolase [Bryobacteraceae bacterium]